jgi:exopolysaccharide production protein ExoQ
MAYGVITCLAAADLATHPRRWRIGALLCFALVLMSRSKTALLCAVAPVALMLLMRGVRRGPAWATGGVFLAGAAAEGLGALLWLKPDALLKMLGKDPTLTGRTDIWAAIFRQLAHQPLLGYGYGAFWLKDSLPAKFIRAETQWLVPSAHNGWIDVLVQVGWIGGALTALTVLAAVLAAALRGWRLQDGGWTVAFLAAFVIRSLSESVLISQNSLDWALFAAALTTLLMRRSAARPRPAAPPVQPFRAEPPPASLPAPI